MKKILILALATIGFMACKKQQPLNKISDAKTGTKRTEHINSKNCDEFILGGWEVESITDSLGAEVYHSMDTLVFRADTMNWFPLRMLSSSLQDTSHYSNYVYSTNCPKNELTIGMMGCGIWSCNYKIVRLTARELEIEFIPGNSSWEKQDFFGATHWKLRRI